MAADGQSKGGSSPHPEKGGGKGGSERRPKAASPPADPPGLAIKMAWLALRYDLGGSWLVGGVPFTFPVVTNRLHEMGAPEGDNVLIVPCPAELAAGLAETHPASCQLVKGRLPELHLHEGKEGANQGLVQDYLDAHPARSTSVSLGDWRKPISLPKA